MLQSKAHVASLLDHSILHPLHTDEDVRAECEVAASYRVAAMCVKPCHVALAVDCLVGSEVPVCAVTAFPHGHAMLAVKLAETQAALDAGAREIDTVINLARVRAGDWPAIHLELEQLQMLVDSHDGTFKAIFETGLLEDEEIRKLCQIANSIPLDFVKTSTGFATVKDAQGNLSISGATEHAVKIMTQAVAGHCEVKASGGIRTLADVQRYQALGCSRVGTSATQSIMSEL